MNRRLFGVVFLLVQVVAVEAAQDEPIMAAGSPLGAAAGELVSLEIQGGTARDLSNQLSALAGIAVVYAPLRGSDQISLQVRGMPLGELVSVLAKQGGVAIAGRGFVSASVAGFDKEVLRQRVTISAKEVDAETVSRLLTRLLDIPVRWTVPDAGMRLNLDFQDVAVQDILEQLDRLGEISVQGVSPRPG